MEWRRNEKKRQSQKEPSFFFAQMNRCSSRCCLCSCRTQPTHSRTFPADDCVSQVFTDGEQTTAANTRRLLWNWCRCCCRPVACGLCRFSYSNDGRFVCVCAGARCATYASSFSGEYWIAFATCTAFKWQHFPIYFLCDGLVRRHSLIFAKNSPSAISVNHRDAISRRQTGVGTNVLRSKANPVSIRRPFSSHTSSPQSLICICARCAFGGKAL